MDLPIGESQYVVSLEELIWGGTLMAVTMAMHGLGMLTILRVNGALKHRFEPKPSFLSGLFILILASWMILLAHLTEVIVWAAFFLWKGAFANHSIAYYFALNEYTTVGSNYNLPRPWRLLEGLIATTGLLTFAWSTGVLLTLAQDFQDQQMQILKQKREKRHLKQAPALLPAANQPQLRHSSHYTFRPPACCSLPRAASRPLPRLPRPARRSPCRWKTTTILT
ncbi:MAG: hypothetical protein NT154_23130 [Verrucomicrobia bacterium]|nr:hypothetical protein [Verrucomicrobiota bacterium]